MDKCNSRHNHGLGPPVIRMELDKDDDVVSVVWPLNSVQITLVHVRRCCRCSVRCVNTRCRNSADVSDVSDGDVIDRRISRPGRRQPQVLFHRRWGRENCSKVSVHHHRTRSLPVLEDFTYSEWANDGRSVPQDTHTNPSITAALRLPHERPLL